MINNNKIKIKYFSPMKLNYLMSKSLQVIENIKWQEKEN